MHLPRPPPPRFATDVHPDDAEAARRAVIFRLLRLPVCLQSSASMVKTPLAKPHTHSFTQETSTPSGTCTYMAAVPENGLRRPYSPSQLTHNREPYSRGSGNKATLNDPLSTPVATVARRECIAIISQFN